MLLVLLRAVVAARERQDHRVLALELAEPAGDVLVVGQFVVGERAARDNVSAHSAVLSAGCIAFPPGSPTGAVIAPVRTLVV